VGKDNAWGARSVSCGPARVLQLQATMFGQTRTQLCSRAGCTACACCIHSAQPSSSDLNPAWRGVGSYMAKLCPIGSTTPYLV
jgi:hypothetical protein